MKTLARRTSEVREIPARADLHLGDEEREDLSEIATIATLEITPAHPSDGWRMTVTVEDELGPRGPGRGSNGADEEKIDLEIFNGLFIRPERGTATVVAQADDAAAEVRLSSLLASIETNRHAPYARSDSTSLPRILCDTGVRNCSNGRLKILVVFYSRSGTTRRIALSRTLKCDLEEITEPKPRTGFLGYARSLLEASRKRPSTILPKKHDVSSFDLVVIGTPVWAWSLSSPVRAYLMATASHLPKVAFFCTLGARGSENAFAQMATIVGKKLRAICAITQREVLSGSYRLSPFEKALKEIIN